MTLSIALVLGILLLAVVLFVTERLRADLVALLVMVSLAVAGVLTGTQAVAGFGNPAVVTIASVLVLGGGLTRTGVANIVGARVMAYAGNSQRRLLMVTMLTTGVLSGFMNNIGVAALMLPVVLDIARRTKTPPSKLLMPLAFASLLGGLTTLIGTAPNILIAGAVQEHGLEPLRMFDFTPVGLTALVSGVLFMTWIGHRLIPLRQAKGVGGEMEERDLTRMYALGQALYEVAIPQDSALAGHALSESHLGRALGLNVLAVKRDEQLTLSPSPDWILHEGDRLLASGSLQHFKDIRRWKHLVTYPGDEAATKLLTLSIRFAQVEIASDSPLAGKTIRDIDFRQKYGVQVLAISHTGELRRTRLRRTPLSAHDRLFVAGDREDVAALGTKPEFAEVHELKPSDLRETIRVDGRLHLVEVPEGSFLAGRSLADSRLGQALGMTVVAIRRGRDTLVLPKRDTVLEPWDILFVQARTEDLARLDALQDLSIDRVTDTELDILESDQFSMAEAALSPHTTVAGKTLRELQLRQRFGITVIGVWRGGQAHEPEGADMTLELGDAFLVFGDRRKIKLLAEHPDFYVLGRAPEVVRREKAPLSTLIMAAVLGSVVSGLLPIYVAAPTGAMLMVLTRCLTMDEAYRFIELKAIVLVAGMLSLGLAMEETGAAQMVARVVLEPASQLGPTFLVAALFLMTVICVQVMPTAAVAVLFTPIALSAAADLGLSTRSLLMVVAVGSSCAFLSPVGHPVNLLVMGFGGYRFGDYARAGLPLVILLTLIVVFVLPIVWPLTP